MHGVPYGVVAVIRTERQDHARTLTQGLLAAGVPGVEVTLTVPGAIEVIAEFTPGAEGRLGAGTVRTAAEVDACVAAGAAYLVSPVFDLSVIERAQHLGVPVVPGALTPTELNAASQAGAAAVKLFPVSTAGGPAYVRSILEPMPELQIVASGGIELAEVEAYFAVGVHAVCLGSVLSDPEAVASGDWRRVADTVTGLLSVLPPALTSVG